jgi:Domain of unknown function (DUF222)
VAGRLGRLPGRRLGLGLLKPAVDLTPGVHRAGTFWLRNSAGGGRSEVRVRFGRRIDLGVVGDWNGNGTWTPGVLRSGSRWYLKDSLSGGAASVGLRKQTPGARWSATGQPALALFERSSLSGRWLELSTHLRGCLCSGVGLIGAAMDSNWCSPDLTAGPPDDLAALAAAVDGLAARDPTKLPDAVRVERVLILRRLVDRLEGHWLGELAGVDACGAAGADQGTQAPSTASWLRNRLHMGAGAASNSVRTARALFRGPLSATAEALCDGEISAAHASVLAHGTHDLADHVATEAEPVLLEAARRMDPPRLRRVLGHLRQVADPDGADEQAERRHGRRGLWLAPTWEGMVALQGLLEPEAGQILLAALEPLVRPHDAQDSRSGDQRRADALVELARRTLEGGQLPQAGGVRPQLLVTVDLDSLLGRPGALGGEAGWVGPLAPEACRRLACDGALTRR